VQTNAIERNEMVGGNDDGSINAGGFGGCSQQGLVIGHGILRVISVCATINN
jgi:hypothetical protein